MRHWLKLWRGRRKSQHPARSVELVRDGRPVPATIRRAGLDDEAGLAKLLLGLQQQHFAADPSVFKAPGGLKEAREFFRVQLNAPRSRAYIVESTGTPL